MVRTPDAVGRGGPGWGCGDGHVPRRRARRGGPGAAYPGGVPIVLRYTLLRLSLLAAVGLALYALGLPPVVWLLLTAVVSLLLSLVLLRGPREQMTQALVERQQQRQQDGRRRSRRLSRRIDADADAEDAADEAGRDGGTGPRR